MQHRPFALHHQRRPAAEWDAPFAPIVVRPVGGAGRRHGNTPHTPELGNGPIVRLAAMYRTVGLREDPFAMAPITKGDDLHLDAAHLVPAIADQARLLSAWMIDPAHRGTLAVITGPARSGRSTLLNAAIQASAHVSPDHAGSVVRPDLVAGNGPLTDGRLLRTIVAAFGLEPAGRTGLDLVRQIRELASDRGRGRGREHAPVLVLDGAELTGSRLDVLRSLLVDANDRENGTSLRIVVTGSPDLRGRVRRRSSLDERLALDLGLNALDEETLANFIARRIAHVALSDEERMKAGGRLPIAFLPEAVTIVAEWSAGIVGSAVELAGECLLEAIARGTHRVDQEIAHDVAREFTDRARDVARHQAASPFAVAAVQARLALPVAGDFGSTKPGTPESSPATTPASGNGEGDR